MENNQNSSRRKFLQQTAVAGAGILLSKPMNLFAKGKIHADTIQLAANIKSKGYAAHDKSGILSPWEFERRPVGDNDILIDIKFASICHSDIHHMRGDWGQTRYPQVPGHEITGIVSAVGKNVTKFKVGDRAGVGCMVSSCMTCESCTHGEEHHCDNNQTKFTYGAPEQSSPTGITQGGYSNNLVVHEHFAVHIPTQISLEEAAPLLCSGVTTYSPLVHAKFNRGDKVAIIGIGGLGHLAIKLAISKGADVYAFTTTADKAKDILSFGAKEAIVIDDISKLRAYRGKMDYALCTIPYAYDASSYISIVKKDGFYTQVGMPVGFEVVLSVAAVASNRVNFNCSMIGGIPETQEVVDYCANNNVLPTIQVIKAEQINDAWIKVKAKEARYRYVIDASTFV